MVDFKHHFVFSGTVKALKDWGTAFIFLKSLLHGISGNGVNDI